MPNPDYLNDLLATIAAIRKVLKSPEPEKMTGAQETYRKLLDDFCERFQEIVAPQQYEAAKQDPDHFIALIQLADYYRKCRVPRDGGEERTAPDWRLFTRC